MRSTTSNDVEVDHQHLGPVVVVVAVGVAADQGPTADERQSPREPADRHPSRHPAGGVELGEPARGRFAHVPAVTAPPGGVGMGQPGEDLSARAQVEDEPDVLARGGLPGLVPLEPPEGAHVQRPVDDQQRVDVPGVGDGAVGACLPQLLGGARRRRATRRRPSWTLTWTAPSCQHTSCGSRIGVETPVAAHSPGVVRQQLAGARLLAGRPQHPPQPAAADA